MTVGDTEHSCTKHPRYQGKRRPRVACEPCWAHWFHMERLRSWKLEHEQRLAAIREANGGKDRPTDRCTEAHMPNELCYGCDDYWRHPGKQ